MIDLELDLNLECINNILTLFSLEIFLSMP